MLEMLVAPEMKLVLGREEQQEQGLAIWTAMFVKMLVAGGGGERRKYKISRDREGDGGDNDCGGGIDMVATIRNDKVGKNGGGIEGEGGVTMLVKMVVAGTATEPMKRSKAIWCSVNLVSLIDII